ncbi:MAG: ion channel DMI1 [Gemmatimonadales bacterium]|nr:MAG: ion channel DMI1 [Gemmatimonadales bacterium]
MHLPPMSFNPRNPRPLARSRFLLERFLLRGPQYRLLLIAAVIGLISVGAGALVLTFGGFVSFPDAVWWAFLRLTDPGYLGDDEGAFVRVVSTLLTLSGYVIFLGSLVAIMTQWLNATMARLESGMTPVSRQRHVVILGFTNRTVSMIRELLLSEERVRRFLSHQGARALHIVVLVEEVNAQLRQQLRDELGALWDEGRITLRSGSPLRVDHLARVDILRAAVVLIPGSDLSAPDEGTVALDTRTVKTLLTLDQAVRDRAGGEEDPDAGAGPLLVVEIHDSRKVALARRAYRGPAEFVASDAVLSRLMAQNFRHPGLSHVYGELLSQDDGNEIYLPGAEELAGVPVEHLVAAFPRGVVLGLVRPDGPRVRPLLNPPPGTLVEATDRVVVLARRWGDVQRSARAAPAPHPRGTGALPAGPDGPRRMLLLGWSPKVPALLRELAAYPKGGGEVDIFSRVDPARRRHMLERHGLGGLDAGAGVEPGERPAADSRPPGGLRVRHLEGDFTVHTELVRADPFGYDGIIVLGGDTHRSGGEADARTILGALLLQEMAAKREHPPGILVEILDPENRRLLNRGRAEVLVTPLLVSHVLAQVALRRELRAVFDELFMARGPEISFHRASELGLDGRISFGDVLRAAASRGQTALGVRPTGSLPLLNPDRTLRWMAGSLDVVLLGTPPDRSREASTGRTPTAKPRSSSGV